MGKIIAIAFGGAAGSLGRYGIALAGEKLSASNFPVGTLFANLLGCLLIGFFWSWFDRVHISSEFRLFIFTGFLGGFTTFSTYGRETVQYFKAGEPFHAIGYIVLSNCAGLALVAAGFLLAERVFRFQGFS